MSVQYEGGPSFLRPCVDCGMLTMRFCETRGCIAVRWCPSEEWNLSQLTPHCQTCEAKFEKCHFCRKVHMATPATWGCQ